MTHKPSHYPSSSSPTSPREGRRTPFQWAAFFLLLLWQAPQNILGAGMWLYFRRKGDVKPILRNTYSTIYSSSRMRGGISLGYFAFLSKGLSSDITVVRHEEGHMWDSKVMGPLYLPLVGLPSLLNAVFRFTGNYYDFFTERWANRHGALESDPQGNLHLKQVKRK